MKISKFKGRDPLWWLFEVYNLFALENTPPHHMVSIASYFLEGEALEWFQDLEASRLCTDWVEFVCSLQDCFRTPIHDTSMEVTTQEVPLELTKIQEFKEILEVEEQSMIQEAEVTSKIDEPITAQESTKIIERPNFQDLNSCELNLKSQMFLEKESLKDDIESRLLYKEITFMCVGPIVKEKCMHLRVKISLSYWLMGRLPLMEFHYLNLEDKIHIPGGWNVMTRISILQRLHGRSNTWDEVLECRTR